MTREAGRHFLQIPGPTNVPGRILRAIERPTIDHRGPAFGVLCQGVLADLKAIFRTEEPVGWVLKPYSRDALRLDIDSRVEVRSRYRVGSGKKSTDFRAIVVDWEPDEGPGGVFTEPEGDDRQAMVAAHMDWQAAPGLRAYTFGAPTTIKSVEIWKLEPTNQGYLDAQECRVWEPETQ